MKCNDPSKYCFMIRNGDECVKDKMAKIHLPHHECEKCIWRVKSENEHHLASLQRLYEKYGNKRWN